MKSFDISLRQRGEVLRYSEADGHMLEVKLDYSNGVTTIFTDPACQWQTPLFEPVSQRDYQLIRNRIVNWLSRTSKQPVKVCETAA